MIKRTVFNWNYRIMNISPLVKELKLQAYWNQVDHLMNDSLRVSSTPSMMVNRLLHAD